MNLASPQLLEQISARCSHEEENDCWHWTGAVNYQGYPVVFDSERKRNVRARTAIFGRLHGGISHRRFVTMTCGERACLNPAHMRIESRSQYMRRSVKHKSADVVARMRESRRRSATAKLTLADAIEIRRLRNDSDLTLQAIGDRYAVSRALVSQIIRNQVWREASPWAI
jgi:hypothetical protein